MTHSNRRPNKADTRKIPKLLDVPVTQEVIDRAVLADSGACIVADAINAAIPGARASVDLQTTTFSFRDAGLRLVLLTPRLAQEALINLDQGNRRQLKPFTLHLHRDDIVQVRALQHNTGKVKADGKAERHDVQLDEGTEGASQQASAGGGKPRTVVELPGGKVVPTGRSRIPPNGVLSTNRGRIRRFGLRQLKPNAVENDG